MGNLLNLMFDQILFVLACDCDLDACLYLHLNLGGGSSMAWELSRRSFCLISSS